MYNLLCTCYLAFTLSSFAIYIVLSNLQGLFYLILIQDKLNSHNYIFFYLRQVKTESQRGYEM